MKKLFFSCLVAFLTLVSCSSDDSNDSSLLLGEWKLIERAINGNNDPLGTCELLNRYTFNSDGTYEVLLYAGDEGTDCSEATTFEVNGTWDYNGGDVFSFTVEGEEPNQVEIEFISNDLFAFEFTETSSPEDPVLVTLREVFERI